MLERLGPYLMLRVVYGTGGNKGSRPDMRQLIIQHSQEHFNHTSSDRPFYWRCMSTKVSIYKEILLANYDTAERIDVRVGGSQHIHEICDL